MPLPKKRITPKNTRLFWQKMVGQRTQTMTQDSRRKYTYGSLASYQYDDNGNLTQKTEGSQITLYTYDTQNRLTEVWDTTGNATKLIARYGYDPMRRRIWKEQYRDKRGNLLAQALRTHYLYADEGLIAEATQAITLNAADNSVTASTAPVITTQYGPKPENSFITGMLFIKTKSSNGSDLVAYYQHNHLDTPIQAIDKTGRIVWAAEYNAFGEASIITPAATADHPTIESNLRLPGQYADQETGLHYNWHRYYDPQTGRYVEADPIGLEGGWNRYAYVGGNPVKWNDPKGLDRWGDDPSLKRVETSDHAVKQWLCKAMSDKSEYQTPGQYLALKREDGLDLYDDNLAAAERFAMAAEGFWDLIAGEQDTILMGKGIVQWLRLNSKIAKKVLGEPGSKSPWFTERWGSLGDFYFRNGLSPDAACQRICGE